MQRSAANTSFLLGEKAVLWQRFRFARGPESEGGWILEFPLPQIDKITVFQRLPSGGWTSQTAGDTVAMSAWPEPARYPQFPLRLTDSAVHAVYVRIEHASYVSLPVSVVSLELQVQRRQWQHMMIGGVFGTLILLSLACAAQSWVYRESG